MAAIGKGTRIKLIRSTHGNIPEGSIGTVMEVEMPCAGDSSPIYLWILYDNFKSKHFTGYFAAKPENVKPVYDGDEKSSWEECVWKPLNVSFPT